jgi:hypothetical protein
MLDDERSERTLRIDRLTLGEAIVSKRRKAVDQSVIEFHWKLAACSFVLTFGTRDQDVYHPIEGELSITITPPMHQTTNAWSF